MKTKERRTTMLQLMVPDDLAERLRIDAVKSHKRPGQILTEALREHFKRKGNTNGGAIRPDYPTA